MDASRILYPIIIILAIYFIYTNLKKNLSYKKDNIKTLYTLNQDDKARHAISLLIVLIVILLTTILLIGLLSAGTFNRESFLSMVLLPVLMIVLYIPLIKKTAVTNLGILKRGALIRWEEIKGVNYYKPGDKNQKVKILYKIAGREVSTDILFGNNDSQYEIFKETVREYRNTKKKDKKSDK